MGLGERRASSRRARTNSSCVVRSACRRYQAGGLAGRESSRRESVGLRIDERAGVRAWLVPGDGGDELEPLGQHPLDLADDLLDEVARLLRPGTRHDDHEAERPGAAGRRRR